MVSNVLITVDGDNASSTSYLLGHHTSAGSQGGDDVTLRARYDDRLVRSTSGWKIADTLLTVISITGNAALLAG